MTKQTTKDIFVWLFIFIIGSLIISFLVSPGSFESFVDNVKSVSSFSFSSTDNTTKLIPSEMGEYGFYAQAYKECTNVQTLGELGGISSPKKTTCIEACGRRDMNYHSYSCDKNLFSCYCVD